jgi:serine/threonine-protein kinase
MDLPLPGVNYGSARVGPYELVRRLGRGGMAEVFEGRHVDLGKRVAIKLLRHAMPDDRAARRVLREGRTATAITHPHVVSVLDVGSHDGAPYLVMELLEGEELAGLLAREGTLGHARIAELLLPVMSGVAAVHAAGIVHRDLKPSNILLARRHRGIEPVVVDFGISRSIAPSQTNASTGIVGTVHYMAPEQLRGARGVTPLTDQYALGVILYECATGGPPFWNDDHYELLHAIMTAPVVPPSELVPGLSPDFDALVLRALARDPKDRFASVEELAEALLPFAERAVRERWAGELGARIDPAVTADGLVFEPTRTRATPVARPRRRHAALALGAVAALAVATAAWHAVRSPTSAAPPPVAAATAPHVPTESTPPAPAPVEGPSRAESLADVPPATPAVPRPKPHAPSPPVSHEPTPPAAPTASAPEPEPKAAPVVERGSANIPIVE